MAYKFGRLPSYLKAIYADSIQHFIHHYREILKWHPSVDIDKAKYFARALRKYGECGTIWDFVDGTFRGFCLSTYGKKKTLVIGSTQRLLLLSWTGGGMLSVNGRSYHVAWKIYVRLRRWKGAQSIRLCRLSRAECSHMWLLGGQSAARSWPTTSMCVGGVRWNCWRAIERGEA